MLDERQFGNNTIVVLFSLVKASMKLTIVDLPQRLTLAQFTLFVLIDIQVFNNKISLCSK